MNIISAISLLAVLSIERHQKTIFTITKILFYFKIIVVSSQINDSSQDMPVY